MSDYFDQFESELRSATRRRAHLPWYVRVRMPGRYRAVAILLAALVVATPAVAAVSGLFNAGKPDEYYAEAPSAGLGKAVQGSRMLPIQVADPDGGPPWGLRLVRTSRGDTCLQVGRVEYGELGSLGIDYSWGNDHLFHAISPNDGVADICGATDAAGHGFVNSNGHGWPASAYTPSDSGSGVAVSYCQAASPLSGLESVLNHFAKGSKARATFEAIVKRREAMFARSKIHTCPAGSLRMIFVGLLGPEAKSINYTTPTGQSETEQTVGGVGAYLIVFKQTAKNCNDYTTTLDSSGGNGCDSNYGSSSPTGLQGPSAVTSVTYDNGTTCSDLPAPSFAAAYRAFTAKILKREEHEPAKLVRQQFARFYESQHLSLKDSMRAIDPSCPPVGWVASEQKPVTEAQVTSPLKVIVVEAEHYCDDGPPGQAYKGQMIPCDGAVPKGYHRFGLYAKPGANGRMGPTEGPPTALVTVTFTARRAVTTSSSWYEWQLDNPGNGGGQGNQTQANVRAGQRLTFTQFVTANKQGLYHGIVSFIPNVGTSGLNGGDNPGHDGSLVVGRFSFKLPLTH